ncbi:MAG: histidine phosphatase family protein [Acidimicrobiales bacterium]
MLVLVRHGEATANASGLLLGRTDVPLTSVGRRQAAALAPDLGPVGRLVSSPLRRALDTAAALRIGGLPVEVDDRWVEVDYGEHEGRPLGDVPADVWRRWRSDPGYRPAGGESLEEVGERVRTACEELFAAPGAGARADDGDVVVVSHVSPIKAAVAWALGTGDGLDWRLRLSTGSVTRIGWGADAPVLHCFNWVPGHPGTSVSGP